MKTGDTILVPNFSQDVEGTVKLEDTWRVSHNTGVRIWMFSFQISPIPGAIRVATVSCNKSGPL
jgi:hypothetical protein